MQMIKMLTPRSHFKLYTCTVSNGNCLWRKLAPLFFSSFQMSHKFLSLADIDMEPQEREVL